MMSESLSTSNKSTARFWAFAGSALLLGPVLSYCFGIFSHLPILFGFPAIALALLGLSIAFGLWSSAHGIVAKTGVVLWAITLAWVSPFVVIYALSFYCAVINSRAGHYVCGI